MVMSTKEQETFETALSARDGFESIKAGLSKVDVRQVRPPRALVAPLIGPRAALSRPSLSLRFTGGVPQRRGQEPDPARAGAGRGLRRVQQAGRRLDAQGAGRSSEGQPGTADGQIGRGAGWPVM